MPARTSGRERPHAPEAPASRGSLLRSRAAEGTRLQVQIVRISVNGWTAHELALLVVAEPQAQAIVHDRAGDLILDVEQVRRVAVVAVGPELPAGGHVDESSGDQQVRTLALDRTRQNRLHSKLTPGRARVHRPAP